MKIGLLVDGEAEYRSLPRLYGRVQTSHNFLKPLKADIQPFAPVSQIIGRVRRILPVLVNRGAQGVIVLLDREDRRVCPGEFAAEISEGLQSTRGEYGLSLIAVVVKESRFENWLVADLSALEQFPKRFIVPAATQHLVMPNKADRCDALKILKAAAQNDAYSKVQDATRILSVADPDRIAENSRSFRRFLRELGHPGYTSQSRSPKTAGR